MQREAEIAARIPVTTSGSGMRNNAVIHPVTATRIPPK